MSTTIFYNNLQRHLFRYADLVEHSNSLGLSNEAIDAEDLFCTFLNKAFRWNLINANENNSGKPLDAACPNCFVCICKTEEEKQQLYWLFYPHFLIFSKMEHSFRLLLWL